MVLATLFSAVATAVDTSQTLPEKRSGLPKQNFFVKLIPPRATFPGDITPEEMATMKRHADYYAAHFRPAAF